MVKELEVMLECEKLSFFYEPKKNLVEQVVDPSVALFS